MLPDFEIIQHNLYGGHDIVIYPIADVHLGAPDQMEQEFMQFLDRLKDEPNAYITLGGDLLNVATKASVSNVYRERYMFSEAKKMMAEMLEPVKDKILCAVCGNHERRTMREVDVDPTYDIMVLLGKEHLYRENIAFVTIRTGEPNTANGKRRNGIYRPVYNLVVCHGSGGGVLTGSALNRNERFGYVIDGMDALISSHTHKPLTSQPAKLFIDSRNGKVSLRPFKVIVATSWLGYSDYAMQKMMLPASHCLQTLTLCGDHKEIKVTM